MFMSDLANIPWSLVLPIVVLQLILMVVALVDLIRHQRTNGPFIMWIFIILLGNIIGSILYFIFGRKQA
ncbi:MAG TPA: PLD nuclease N-terminal domain-containing protein [Sporosarcina sp.]|nr:PLD nuclease N-terminal domain-containing protein [Sporosarcina sp.]